MDQPRTPKRAETREEPQISAAAREKAEAAKAFIAEKYSKKKREDTENREYWDEINKRMVELNLSETEQRMVREEIMHKEAERLRSLRARTSIFDFEPITIIGRGAFGEVRVVRHKSSGEILALKKMNKTEMIRKNQIQHVRAERNVLAKANNPWIVELKYSFQDEKYLYLAMEYLQGGDLMTVLIKRDILPQDEAKFYIAEMVLAVESVHKLNYIHRDIKPDNVLIGRDGHIKLSDFGLCKLSDIQTDNLYSNLNKLEDEAKAKQYMERRTDYKRNRALAYSTVGTPDYIAPEVFGRGGYTETVDWWSVGVILFEMVVGYPPFFSDEPSITCQKILHWRNILSIPREANLRHSTCDLIRKLVCDAGDRLGSHGVEEIKAHPFFNGIDWENMRSTRAPWIPELRNDYDSSNFDNFDEVEPFYPPQESRKKKGKKDSNFINYTYKKEDEDRAAILISALNELEAIKKTHSSSRQENSPSQGSYPKKLMLSSQELYSD